MGPIDKASFSLLVPPEDGDIIQSPNRQVGDIDDAKISIIDTI
jgi:hypothetical protein